MRRWIVVGVILIVIGLALEALIIAGIGTRLLNPGALFLGAIGGGLLAAYVYTGVYGFLIPGCILSSLWLTITVVEAVPFWPGDLDGAIILGGLAASFFAIYLVDLFHAGKRRIWPVWPGLGFVFLSVVVAISSLVPESFVGAFVLAGPGVVLLIIYLWRREYPFLIPACLLIALGLVIPVLPTWTGAGREELLPAALVMGALGVAFLAMYVVDKVYTRASNWWPLIPGLILLVIGGFFGLTALGMGLTAEQWELLSRLQVTVLPLGLIALGTWLVLRWALRGRRETTSMEPPQDS